MAYEQTPALEALERQAEAATALLTPLAEAATRRLQDLAAELEQADAEPLGLNTSQRQMLRRTAQRLRSWADADGNASPIGYLTRAQFARLAQVSANTLVKWHAAGSLVPAYTHPLTHYRYYRPEQVAEVRNARQRKPRKVAK
jgi:DNA-binding transcriptional MerR regulator